MVDKNGIEIRTGDVVRVSNAYFKCDNGVYFVDNSPGDPSWIGNDYSLHRIKRNGELATGKNRVAFWPLAAFTSDRSKNAAAREWNREHAEIEIIKFDKIEEIRKHFADSAYKTERQIEYYVWHCGWNEHGKEIRMYKDCVAHYKAVAKRLAA